MKVEDVLTSKGRLLVPLHEKGGEDHSMPYHHTAERSWLRTRDGAVLAAYTKGPRFRTVGQGTGDLTRTSLPRANAHAMIYRRDEAAGIKTLIVNRSFCAAGIIACLRDGGTLEKSVVMAKSRRRPDHQLCDRRRDDISLDEVERILIEGVSPAT